MERRLLAIAFLFAAATLFPSPAQSAREIGVRGYAWHPDISADLQTIDGGTGGTRFDLVDDAGLIEKNFGVGEISFRTGKFHIRGGYTPALMNGDKTLERDIVFAGRTYPAGTQVFSHICVDIADLEIQYDPVRFDAGEVRVDLGVIAKIRYVNARAELHAAIQSGERSFAAPYPAVGAAAGVLLPGGRIRADVRISWGAYSANRMLDAELFASAAILPRFRLQGGYRHVSIDMEADDILAEIRMKGPYLGGELIF
jgi:hypothetical protein